MIEFIFKVKYLLEKIKHLTAIKVEKGFLEYKYADILKKDEKVLRDEMAELKAIKDPSTDTKKLILDYEKEISKIYSHKDMILMGENKIKEHSELINYVKSNLWK